MFNTIELNIRNAYKLCISKVFNFKAHGIMLKNCLIIFYLFLALSLQSCSSVSTPNTPATQPVSLDKAYFKMRLTTTERDSEEDNYGEEKSYGKTIIFSTINGYNKQRLLTQYNVIGDSYISATVNKTTDEVTYQIDSIIEYKDHDARLYKHINYTVNGRQYSGDGTLVDQTMDCKGNQYSGCLRKEHVAFTMTQQTIEQIAINYTEGSQDKWRYTLSPERDRSYSAHLFVAEIAALVEAVNENKRPPNL